VLTQCIFRYEAFGHLDDGIIEPNLIDYCIYFIFQFIKAFTEEKTCILNKVNFLQTYYRIVEMIFKVVDP